VGFDITLGIFLTDLTVIFLLNSIGNKKWLYFAVISSIASVYSYHSEKIVVPILLLTFWLLFRKELSLKIKNILILISILFLFLIPVLIGLTNNSGQSRAKGSLITNYLFNSTKDSTYELTASLINENNGIVTNIFNHSRIALSFSDISSKFYAYLSPANLFVTGDEVGRHGVEDFGVLMPFESIFIISGIYFFIKEPKKNLDRFLLVWFLAGLLPAMLTMDELHTGRSYSAVTPLYIFESWGLLQLLNKIKEKNIKFLILIVSLLFIAISFYFLRFTQSYFVYTPIKRADVLQYGYKQVVETVKEEQGKIDRVIVDSPPDYGYTYIFFLFYQQYEPTVYNSTVRREDD
jgi:hypothetical protein